MEARPIVIASKRLLIVFVLGVFQAGITLAQVSDVTQPPPSITFAGPREIRSTITSEILEYEFPSAIPSGIEANDTVPVSLYLPLRRSSALPAVIILHYLGATELSLEHALAADLNRDGVAAAVVSLPYHLKRTPPGKRSGELAVVPDPAAMRRTMIQSVSDVRRTIDLLCSLPELDPTRIGITGTSLGAIVSAITFAVESRVTSAAFMLGGVDLAHILWHSSKVVAQRDALRRKGFTEDTLRKEFEGIEPLTYLRSGETRPTFVIGARFDTVVPPADTNKLIEAIQARNVLWLESGHYGGALVQSRLLRSVSRFFRTTFQNEPFRAPKSLHVPTIRLGFLASGETGLQVAIGFDVWRSNSRGDAYACVLLSPRGLHGYLGLQVSKGISLGLSLRQKRATWGAFWNVVL